MALLTITYDAGFIEFDATLTETHPTANVITEHPVEKGVNVTDHVRPEVDRVQIDVYVTNTPIRVPRTNLDGASGGVAPLDLTVPSSTELPIAIPGVGAALKGAGLLNGTTTVRATTLQFDDFDRVSSIFHELNTIRESATLITISTSLREYENFVIQSIVVPRQTGEGTAAHFQIEARQLRFVTTQTVAAPKQPVGAAKLNRGPKSTTDGGPKSSLAVKAAKGLGLLQ